LAHTNNNTLDTISPTPTAAIVHSLLNPDPNPNPNPNSLTDRRVFTVYRPSITFTFDSGTTDILVTHRDSTILSAYTPFTSNSSRPGRFLNRQSVHYLPYRYRPPPHSNTTISLTAYVFNDTDLSDNLFGLAPLINLGYTAIYTRTGISIGGSVCGRGGVCCRFWRWSSVG
jgi:hypothetical protein